MIWIIILLILSLGLNGLLLWYIRQTLRKLLFASENFGLLKDSIDSFKSHLEGIYELEMFYGDDTLGGLISHSKDLVEDMQRFEEIYTLMEEDEDDSAKGDEE